jgi:Ca2+-dependent lipid-binding protein
VARSGGVIRFEVFDSDSVSKDDLLGYVEVPLEAFLDGEKVDVWLKLKLAVAFKNLLKEDKLKRTTSHSTKVFM